MFHSILQALNDDTKILTDTETFFPIPNIPKPIPRLFSDTKFFRNRNRYFFSETKNSETETETSFPIPNFPKPKPILFSDTKFFETETEIIKNLAKVSRPRPKPRLLNIFYIFYNFWTDTQLNELLPTNNGLVHIFHILRNTNFWSLETPPSPYVILCIILCVLLPSLMAFLDALASLGSMLETQSVT